MRGKLIFNLILKKDTMSTSPPLDTKFNLDLKDSNVDFDIFRDLSWSIKAQKIPFNPVSNICRLCLEEKFMILFEPADASLNQRSEFFTTCRHKEAWLLVNKK